MSLDFRFSPRAPRSPLGSFLLCAVFVLGSASASAAVPVSEAPRKPQTYRVKSGDTLRLIALRVYGAKRHWSPIYYANRSLIGTATHRIYPGTVLTLPPLPQAASVRAGRRKPTRSSTLMTKSDPLASVLPLDDSKLDLKPPVPLDPPSGVASLSPEPSPVLDDPAEPSDSEGTVIVLPTPPTRVSPMLPAAASLLVPGSGQLLRGDRESGFSHLGLAAFSLGAIYLGNQGSDPGLRWAGGVGLVGISLWSAWDAYRHAEAVTIH